MINSRSLDDLHHVVADKARRFIDLCDEAGIDILVTSTYRDSESQAALYAQGRSKPGPRKTNAKPGQSFHNWQVAFDVVPLRNGKPVWSTKGADGQLWQKIGAIGESVGLEWSGRWTGRMVEFAHFQYTGGLKLADFQSGRHLA